VCSGGKLRKSSQVLYRSDQGKNFLKINQNYFAHICPEYGFRVNIFCLDINRLIIRNQLRIQMSIFNMQINYLQELFCTYRNKSVICFHEIICIHIKL